MKKFTLEIEAGDKIQVGRFNVSEHKITDIELDRFGHPVLILDNGRKKSVFNLRLSKLIPEGEVKREIVE
tara:strand:- start:2236 stop:2445 length:210 start_codon:yes stop_codon:yes gene_type:complete